MATELTVKLASVLHSPLVWVLATLIAYRLALAIQRRLRWHPLAHPVAVATAILVAVLSVTGVDYETYFRGAQAIHWLLGPATVALALPLYKQFKHIKRNWRVFALSAFLGCCAAVASSVSLAYLLGLPREMALALASRSVTMPIALGITERLNGTPSLTAAFVMLTGILGAGIAPAVVQTVLRSRAEAAGLALGVSAHGIGTSRGLQMSQETGAYAGLGMGLAALITAPLVPPLLRLFGY